MRVQQWCGHRLTSSEGGGGGVTADLSTPGHQRHLVLGVRPQAVDAVLLVRGENLHAGLIRGVRAEPVEQGDFAQGGYGLGPADQSRGVGHILHLHLARAVDLWGGVDESLKVRQ